jgi:D-amino-acid dehydrogenase
VRTIVLGAGIAGTLTAYHLLREGHEVTVVDRQQGAGLETSFANGGFMASSQAEPWAAPGVPLKILKWLGREDAPLLLRLGAVPQMWRWGLRFLANCTEARALASGERNFTLAHYSIAVLKEIRAATQVSYDETIKGCIRIYGSAEAIDAAGRFYDKLTPLGLNYRVLDAAACAAIEPALAASTAKFAGGLFFPDEESGDCHKFTQAIASVCQQGGAVFRYGTNVAALEASGDAITAVVTDQGRLTADRYVLALGSYTPRLVRALRLDLPICPVKGYSVTVPAAPWPGALTVPIADDERKFGLARFGDRVRASGSAEITGYDTTPSAARAEAILKNATDLFPDFARCLDPARNLVWCGLRPVTPDGPPILGASPYRNLFLNSGHGHMGWTFGCGAGKAVAALVAGKTPEIDLAGYSFDRFGRSTAATRRATP